MRDFPEENDLLSLFECEPKLFDSNMKNLPFYYNQATYQFSNGEEDFVVTVSPSYGEVKIKVTQTSSDRMLSLLELKRIEKMEITADRRDSSSVLLTVINEDSQQTIEIDFKPRFKLILKEYNSF
ncbi:hypothetical protein ACFWM3_18240 [Gottfriedia sp. NPDC058432]|uniref:hypothetical protein n=1 Tax=Gottfriedia sp. NPDC058432 TaxID=3346497 RepID=UPI00366A1E06